VTTTENTTELAAVHRTARERLAPWEALARAEVDLATAEARARAAGQTEDEIARAKELFAPVDLADTIALLEREAAADGGTPRVAGADDAEAIVLPIRKPWFLPSVAAAAVVLVSAGLWWTSRQSPDGTVLRGREAPTMVDHELAIIGVAEVRGDATPVATVPMGGKVRFVLRPVTRHEVAPVVWACAVRDGEAHRIDIDLSHGEVGGAMQATATLPTTIAAGQWELVAFVASDSTSTEGDAACDVAPSPSIKIAKAPMLVR
jgi:hypothetical protein